MSFWDRWFNQEESKKELPGIRFGRYSDSYKRAEQHDAWEAALQQFETKQYEAAYVAFLTYLSDAAEANVRWRTDPDGGIAFELYQGSKRIVGHANDQRLRAEARVAHMRELRPQLLRRLIAQNFSLRYGRYAIDEDNNITLIFDTQTLDASPYKLYYGLKEVATQADKQDDLLLEEFRQLTPVGMDHLEELPEAEKKVKSEFTTHWISEVLHNLELNRPHPQQHPGGVAYLLLNLIYKIDYLVKPEGYTMETLERSHRLYFSKEDKADTIAKNEVLRQALDELRQRTPSEYYREMYRGRSTFGITMPVTHDRLVTLINNELPHMDWYQEHDYPTVALAIPGYIAGYALFNYAVPPPDRDLLHLYFRIVEDRYFQALGFAQNFQDSERGTVNRRSVRQAIAEVVSMHQARYTRLRPATSLLVYDNITDFSRSYLEMIRGLDLSK